MARHAGIACVDLDGLRLSVVEVCQGEVVSWTAGAVAAEAVRGGEVVDVGILGAHLSGMMASAGMAARAARISMPDETCVLRRIALPAMPRRHLVGAAGYAAERELPFPLERASWSWDVIECGRDSVSILVAATWRDVVDRLLEVAQLAGLDVEVVEPRSVAIGRAIGAGDALLMHAENYRLEASIYRGAHAVFQERVTLGAEMARWKQEIANLVRRSLDQPAAMTFGPEARIVLSGDLETAPLRAALPVVAAREAAAGRGPKRPDRFPAGHYLANLGMAGQEGRRP